MQSLLSCDIVMVMVSRSLVAGYAPQDCSCQLLLGAWDFRQVLDILPALPKLLIFVTMRLCLNDLTTWTGAK